MKPVTTGIVVIPPEGEGGQTFPRGFHVHRGRARCLVRHDESGGVDGQCPVPSGGERGGHHHRGDALPGREDDVSGAGGALPGESDALKQLRQRAKDALHRLAQAGQRRLRQGLPGRLIRQRANASELRNSAGLVPSRRCGGRREQPVGGVPQRAHHQRQRTGR